MCGRFTLYSAFDDIIDQFDIDQFFPKGEYQPSYNVAPSQNILAIINDGSNNRLGKLRWGLIPPWAKDEKIGYKTINARAETITEKPVAFEDRLSANAASYQQTVFMNGNGLIPKPKSQCGLN